MNLYNLKKTKKHPHKRNHKKHPHKRTTKKQTRKRKTKRKQQKQNIIVKSKKPLKELNREDDAYNRLMHNMDVMNHPLAEEPFNNDAKQQLYNNMYNIYLRNALEQSKHNMGNHKVFDYNDYRQVFRKELEAKKEMEKFANSMVKNIDEFEFPKASTNNKKIVMIMAHSSVCSWSRFKQKAMNNPEANSISRTKILNKYDNMQLLSTQSIGRSGLTSFYFIFFELLQTNTVFHNAILELTTQSDAENLNKLFEYFVSITNQTFYQLEKKFIGKSVVEFTNFRIYPKKTTHRHPLNNIISFYPHNRVKEDEIFKRVTVGDKISYSLFKKKTDLKRFTTDKDVLTYKYLKNHEVIGVFDITKLNEYGLYDINSIVFEHLDLIKDCFKVQVINGKTLLDIIKFSLLIPDKQTITKLEEAFATLSPPVLLEDYLVELKYNYDIFDLITKNKSMMGEISLETIIEIVHDLNMSNDDIILVDNTCKDITNVPIEGKKYVNILESNVVPNDNDFDIKKIIKKHRRKSRSTNINNVEVEPERNFYFYVILLKEDTYWVSYEKQIRKKLEDLSLEDFKKLLEDEIKSINTLLPYMKSKLHNATRVIKKREQLKDSIKTTYLLNKIIETYHFR